jgi:hypothetical protein
LGIVTVTANPGAACTTRRIVDDAIDAAKFEEDDNDDDADVADVIVFFIDGLGLLVCFRGCAVVVVVVVAIESRCFSYPKAQQSRITK